MKKTREPKREKIKKEKKTRDEKIAEKVRVKRALTPEQRRRRRRSRISNIILVVILLIGAGIMAYPTVSDWWNSFHMSRAIATYANTVLETDTAVLEQMLDDAHDYNERLLHKANRYEMSDEELAEYESLLDLSGNGVIGYITIPKINVNLPIYHGTAENVLQIAVGHIEGTSLPVGGESTHAALSGHRGLPRAKLFTDLDELVEGDTFIITVLNEVLTYEVDQIRIVEPSDMSDLNIVSGGDYVTLITCTPYGVNTHRMLVRGVRTENEEDEIVILPDGLQIPQYIVIPAVSIPLLFLLLIFMLAYYRNRTPKYVQAELLRQLREGTVETNDKRHKRKRKSKQ